MDANIQAQFAAVWEALEANKRASQHSIDQLQQELHSTTEELRELTKAKALMKIYEENNEGARCHRYPHRHR